MKKKVLLFLMLAITVSLFAREVYPTGFTKIDETFFSIGKKDGSIRIFSEQLDGFKILNKIDDKLTGLVADGDNLIISAGEGVGNLYKVDKNTGKVLLRKSLGHNLMDPKVVGDKLLVCDRFRNQLHVLNKNTFKLIHTINTVREIISVDATQSGIAVVCGIMPEGAATDFDISSFVGVIDIKAGKEIRRIKLPAGSTSVRSVAVSPDEKWAVVNHVLGRFMVPTTQIDRGWINTNAISLFKLDGANTSFYTTILLDSVDFGAANPFQGVFDKTGEHYWIAISGTDEVMGVQFNKLIEKLEAENPKDLPFVTNQLSYISYVSKRSKINGQGPRNLFVDDEHLYVMSYFSESVEKYRLHDLLIVNEGNLNLQNGKLGKENLFDITKDEFGEWGEYLFATGKICFQSWQSCISCHPDARVDGLNWDLLNDGIGNPKQTKSMFLSHQTPPVMITGVRARAEVAVRAGVRHILFLQRPEMEMIAMDKYLSNLKAVPSPWLSPSGKLNAEQKRGKVLAKEASCIDCHSGPLYTDMKMYSFGLGSDRDRVREFDTPTLIELWRTAPYMYDGRHVTLYEMLEESRESGRHGDVKGMSNKDLKAIEAWLLTL